MEVWFIHKEEITWNKIVHPKKILGSSSAQYQISEILFFQFTFLRKCVFYFGAIFEAPALESLNFVLHV